MCVCVCLGSAVTSESQPSAITAWSKWRHERFLVNAWGEIPEQAAGDCDN